MEKNNSNDRIIGIDLGTTNCCVAIYEGNGPTVIANNESGKNTTPSIVYYGDKRNYFGDIAKNRSAGYAAKTISSIKRIIGKQYDDITEEAKKLLPYKVVKGELGKAAVDVDGTIKYPEAISADILRHLKCIAEDYLGEKITRAVITVPAYFNNQQREATKAAAAAAGLKAERLINEPTAAAMQYGYGGQNKKDALIAVYDFGGGTFDISIVRCSDGVIEVKSTNGDTNLGGDDVDNALLQYVMDEFVKIYGEKIDNANDIRILKEECKQAKEMLSGCEDVTINQVLSQNRMIDINITRAKFENLISNLLQRTVQCCETAIKEAKIEKKDIDHVILVGGSTRIPAVSVLTENLFGKKPRKNINPDEAVANGAAIQAGTLEGKASDVLLLDVTSLSLGIETSGGIMTVIIDKNTSIPVSRSQVFSTAADNQVAVTIKVLQGERSMAADNNCLGEFTLTNIQPAPRGVPQIEVSFNIDSSGIISVSAVDKKTNNKQEITVNSGNLSQDQINRMIKESEENAEKDTKTKELVSVKNHAESSIYTAESLIKDKNTDEEKGKKLKDEIQKLKVCVSEENIEKINKQIEELGKLCIEIQQENYKKNAAKNTGNSDNSSNSDTSNSQKA